MHKNIINYFELYNIPVSFQVDPKLLEKRYQDLSRHEQNESSEKASLINKGYKIFQDEYETIRYVLEIKNLITKDEEYPLDPQFLMEVRDINEELMELELDERQEQLINVEQKTNQLLLKIYEDVAPVIDSYKEGITTEEELLQVKDFYFQKKYLQGILDRIKGIRNIASPL